MLTFVSQATTPVTTVKSYFSKLPSFLAIQRRREQRGAGRSENSEMRSSECFDFFAIKT